MTFVLLTLLFLVDMNLAAEPRVAVLFSGSLTHLPQTTPMILQRLLWPLFKVANVTVLVHSYAQEGTVDAITASKLNENARILHPKDFVIENQDDARQLNAIADPMNKCPQQNRAGSEDLSRRSFLGQLHSLQRLSQLVERQGQFDVIVFARSDVVFYTAMDAHQILGMDPNTIFVPPFGNRDGVNAQFAFGSAKAMKQYLTRITEVGEYCSDIREMDGHAERFLGWFLERHQLSIRRTPMLFGHLLLRSPQNVYEHPDWQMMRVKDKTIDGALESFN